jgi:SH3 domain-containing YSC84-like protein 1
VSAPDKRIPKELLERAECIGVFPGVKKGAFIVGGEFGRGVFTCRKSNGTMGAPAFFKMGGPSIGWQWGGESTDLVLLIMNDTGMHHLLQDKFTLGGEAAAVSGSRGTHDSSSHRHPASCRGPFLVSISRSVPRCLVGGCGDQAQ